MDIAGDTCYNYSLFKNIEIAEWDGIFVSLWAISIWLLPINFQMR